VNTFDVAIVGLGPTGATLANFCGALGLRTVVFERSTTAYPQPRACHLDAEIARVFQQLGFESQLHDLLTVSAGMEYVAADGARLFTFEGFEREPLLGWHEDYVFIQPELDTMLRDGLARFPCVDVRLGIEADPVADLLEQARFVVACDGASSAIRTQLGIDMRDLGFDERWFVVDVLVNDDAHPLPPIIQQVCDRQRLATFVPSHGRHRRWEFRLADDEHVPDEWRLLEPWGVLPNDAELLRAVVYRFHALEAVRWRVGEATAETRRPIRHLFLFIGASPNTDWLSGSAIALDAKGFVLTGDAAGGDRLSLETSRRGIFAIGDVRAGSVKRVAAAVGEGAQVVAALHGFLTDRRQTLGEVTDVPSLHIPA